MKWRLIFVLFTLIFSLSPAAEHKRVRLDNVQCGNYVSINPLSTDFTVELCFTFEPKSKAHSDYECYLSIVLCGVSDSSTVKIVERVTAPGDIYEKRTIDVALNETGIKTFTTGVDLYGGDNYLMIKSDGDKADIFIGDDMLRYCGSLPADAIHKVEVKECENVSFPLLVAVADTPDPILNRRDIDSVMASANAGESRPPVGIWRFFDRDNNPDHARPGGMYELAVIPSEQQDEYLVIYISGASVNRSAWRPGMVKGILSPTPFEGRYRLKWWDSMMNCIDCECHAILADGTLSFCFPLLNSTLRFSH